MSSYYKMPENRKNNKIKNFISKVLLSIIFVLSSLIFINYSDKTENLYKKYILSNNISFSKINKIYNKYFGGIVSKQSDNTIAVFEEESFYNSIEEYEDGYKVYLNQPDIKLLQSGIIVFVGDKDDLGKTVIVQGVDGTDIWYSNLNIDNYNMYDYVTKGSNIGTADGEYIFLTFQKGNDFITYEEYL